MEMDRDTLSVGLACYTSDNILLDQTLITGLVPTTLDCQKEEAQVRKKLAALLLLLGPCPPASGRHPPHHSEVTVETNKNQF